MTTWCKKREFIMNCWSFNFSEFVKRLVEDLDLFELECKLDFYRVRKNSTTGAYEQEHATPLYSCHGVFIDRFIFRSNLLWMRLPWKCHNQSQDTNWRHCATGPELPFFHKRKGVLKIDHSVKMPWHRFNMGVASSCLSAPAGSYNTLRCGGYSATTLKPL